MVYLARQASRVGSISYENCVKRGYRNGSAESAEWLKAQMSHLGISGLEELHQKTGIDRGSLSRYFRQERVPGIDVIAHFASS